jgi:hypothetical protein
MEELRCVVCGKKIDRKKDNWGFCSICGKPVCSPRCMRAHFPKCMALAFGVAEEVNGELVPKEKGYFPISFLFPKKKAREKHK